MNKEIMLSEKAQQELRSLQLNYTSLAQSAEAARLALTEFARIARQTLKVPAHYKMKMDGTGFYGE